jgi:uncharacterized protein (TIGR02466 family)
MTRLINEHIIFFNSIFETLLDDIDNSQVITEINNLKKNDIGRSISNVGGWQSNDLNINNLGNYPTLYQLAKEMIKATNEVVQTMEIAEEVSISNFWCNVNKNKDFNLPHSHPQTIFSGVYYVKVPENSGDLIFERPDNQQYFFVPKKYSEYTFQKYILVPQEGVAVFFPAYLDHYVQPNTTNEERISVAFNFI